MKPITMIKRLKLQESAVLVVCLCIGLLLVSCSGMPVKRPSAGTSNSRGSPEGSEGAKTGVNDEGKDFLSDTVDDWAEGESEIVWQEVEGEDTTGTEGSGGGAPDSSSPDQENAAVLEEGAETAKDGAHQDELKIEEKNAQALAAEKEEENSDQSRLYDAIDFCQKSQELWKQGNLEKAKRFLDQAYQSILDIKSNGDPEIIQQIDDLRFLIAKRVLEIYASRFNGVKGNHNEIPLTMNDHVQAEIKRFQAKEREFFLESYVRSGRYRPLIVEKLEEAGLPLDLSWLPLIESGFKVRALSRSRALGLWQFIPSTGYKFGLKRNQWIDERMDVEKATNAAIVYLKELHEIFGDWTTVLAAYNCGEGTVLRVIRRQKINYLDNFWDLYEKLPRETARYVPRYMAVLHIIKDPRAYGFELNGLEAPVFYEEAHIDKPVLLKDVAGAIGVPECMLIELNPELRYKATPKDYSLRVPPDRAQLLLAKLDNISRYTPPKKQYVVHRVRRGETLSHIARRYRVSVRAIANANGIVQKDFIRTGQNLKIPVR
jgi:membrane-bound lytic murein transglycosylase D